MSINIKNPQVEELARQLAAQTGESLTQAILRSLQERLARATGRRRLVTLAEDLNSISQRCARLPTTDARPSETILGYDEHGLPH